MLAERDLQLLELMATIRSQQETSTELEHQVASEQDAVTQLEHQVASQKGIHQRYLGKCRKRQKMATDAASNLHIRNARIKSQVAEAKEAARLAVGRHKRAIADAAKSGEQSDVNLRKSEAANANAAAEWEASAMRVIDLEEALETNNNSGITKLFEKSRKPPHSGQMQYPWETTVLICRALTTGASRQPLRNSCSFFLTCLPLDLSLKSHLASGLLTSAVLP